jgi:hypothetical protein
VSLILFASFVFELTLFFSVLSQDIQKLGVVVLNLHPPCLSSFYVLFVLFVLLCVVGGQTGFDSQTKNSSACCGTLNYHGLRDLVSLSMKVREEEVL